MEDAITGKVARAMLSSIPISPKAVPITLYSTTN